jgi:hypothetical protein
VKLCGGLNPRGFNVHHGFKLWARPFTKTSNALTCGSSHDSGIRCASTESRPIKDRHGLQGRQHDPITHRESTGGAPFRAAGLGYEYPPERASDATGPPAGP